MRNPAETLKKMNLYLLSPGIGKENVAVHKKCLHGNNDAIFR